MLYIYEILQNCKAMPNQSNSIAGFLIYFKNIYN